MKLSLAWIYLVWGNTVYLVWHPNGPNTCAIAPPWIHASDHIALPWHPVPPSQAHTQTFPSLRGREDLKKHTVHANTPTRTSHAHTLHAHTPSRYVFIPLFRTYSHSYTRTMRVHTPSVLFLLPSLFEPAFFLATSRMHCSRRTTAGMQAQSLRASS